MHGPLHSHVGNTTMATSGPTALQRKRQLADHIIRTLHWELGPVDDYQALADVLSRAQLLEVLVGLRQRVQELDQRAARGRPGSAADEAGQAQPPPEHP